MSAPMNPTELRERSTDDLNLELGELKRELFNLRFQHHTNQLENTMQMTNVKRNIARIKTILNERARQG